MADLKDYFKEKVYISDESCGYRTHEIVREMYYTGQYIDSFDCPSWQGDVGTEPLGSALQFLRLVKYEFT